MKYVCTFLLMCILLPFAGVAQYGIQNFPKKIELVKDIPNRDNIWVFILAGQSNMAGRGYIEPEDTVSCRKILTINSKDQLIYAKEPVHFYEECELGLDCGLSFARTLIKSVPDSIYVLILPTAVGGSTLLHWIGDSLHRDVQLLTNFKQKAELGKKYGVIKGILWHQGESDANEEGVNHYPERLSQLFKIFRNSVENDSLPILTGELRLREKDTESWSSLINKCINDYSSKNPFSGTIHTSDLDVKDDGHFNSNAQRTMGKKFAELYIREFK